MVGLLAALSKVYVNTDILQTAIFNFQSALLVLLLLICTSAYVHQLFPGIMDRNKDGFVDTLLMVCYV